MNSLALFWMLKLDIRTRDPHFSPKWEGYFPEHIRELTLLDSCWWRRYCYMRDPTRHEKVSRSNVASLWYSHAIRLTASA